jgi:hypothetical protein
MQAQGQFKGSMWILSVARTNMTLCWLWWQELYNKKKQHKTSKGEVEDKNFVKKYCVFCSDVCQLWRLWSRLARLRPVLFPGQVSIGPFRLESCRMHLQHVCTSIYIYILYIYMTNLKAVYNDGLLESFTMQRLFLGSFCPALAPRPTSFSDDRRCSADGKPGAKVGSWTMSCCHKLPQVAY